MTPHARREKPGRAEHRRASGARRAVVDLHLVEFLIGARIPWSVTRLRRTVTGVLLFGALGVAGATAALAVLVPPLLTNQPSPDSTLLSALWVLSIYVCLSQLAWGLLSYHRERLIASPHSALLRAVDGSAAPAALISWLPHCAPVNAALFVAGATLAVASPTAPVSLRLIVILMPITTVVLMISIGLAAASHTRRNTVIRSARTPPLNALVSFAIGAGAGAFSAVLLSSLLSAEPSGTHNALDDITTSLTGAAPYAVTATLVGIAICCVRIPGQYSRCHSTGIAIVRRTRTAEPGSSIWRALSTHARDAARQSGAVRTVCGALLLAGLIIGYRAVELANRCVETHCLAEGNPFLAATLLLTTTSELASAQAIGDPTVFGEISRAQIVGAVALLAAHATSLNILDGLIRRSGPRAIRNQTRLAWELGGELVPNALSVYGACARIVLLPSVIIGASFVALGVPWAALCPVVALATAAAACVSDAILPQANNSDDTAATDIVVVVGTVACSMPLVAGMIYGTALSRTIAIVATAILIGVTLWIIARSIRTAPRTKSFRPSNSQSTTSPLRSDHTASSTELASAQAHPDSFT